MCSVYKAEWPIYITQRQWEYQLLNECLVLVMLSLRTGVVDPMDPVECATGECATVECATGEGDPQRVMFLEKIKPQDFLYPRSEANLLLVLDLCMQWPVSLARTNGILF